MSDKSDLGEMLPFEPSEVGDDMDIDAPEIESEQPEDPDVIEIPVICPGCHDAMSLNTVVDQADREHEGRSRYEAACTDCQIAVIITVMKTVGTYDDLMGFDSPEIDWELKDLSEP